MKRKLSILLALTVAVSTYASPVFAAATTDTVTAASEATAAPAPKATTKAAPKATAKPAPKATTAPAPKATPAPAPKATAAPAPKATAAPKPVKKPTPAVDPVASAAPVDVVAAASAKESSDPAALSKGLSADGTWIFAILSDVTSPGLAVAGEFHDKGEAANAVYRKLALYAQDENRKVTAEYTLTVPNMYVTSPNFNIVNGKVVGDIYVNATGFVLNGTTVEGNVCFETQAQKDSANLEKGTVSGTVYVKESVDAVSAASANKESSTPADIIKGLSANGTWIFSLLSDAKVDGLTVAGTFHDKGDATAKVYRKLALYSQSDAHIVTDNFTLTVPNMTVTSPNFRIQNGTVVGDIYVNAMGFELAGTTVQGNVCFENQAQMDSANLKAGKVTGTVGIKNSVDAVSAASKNKESSNANDIKTGLSASGTWIFSVLSDATVDSELSVRGTFRDKGASIGPAYRKLALYSQDAAHNVTDNFTLTVSKMYVESPNFRIQNGTVVGDIYVNASGFNLLGTTVKGNVYFYNASQMASAKLGGGTVTGTVSIKY